MVEGPSWRLRRFTWRYFNSSSSFKDISNAIISTQFCRFDISMQNWTWLPFSKQSLRRPRLSPWKNISHRNENSDRHNGRLIRLFFFHSTKLRITWPRLLGILLLPGNRRLISVHDLADAALDATMVSTCKKKTWPSWEGKLTMLDMCSWEACTSPLSQILLHMWQAWRTTHVQIEQTIMSLCLCHLSAFTCANN